MLAGVPDSVCPPLSLSVADGQVAHNAFVNTLALQHLPHTLLPTINLGR